MLGICLLNNSCRIQLLEAENKRGVGRKVGGGGGVGAGGDEASDSNNEALTQVPIHVNMLLVSVMPLTVMFSSFFVSLN